MRRPLLAGAGLSLVAHAAATLLLFTLPVARTSEKRPVQSKQLAIDVTALPAPEGGGGTAHRDEAHAADDALAGGDTSRQNIDALDPGQGGDATGALVSIRLLTHDDPVLLFDSPLNNLAASQLQRIRTARDRATLERRRATPNPHDQPFLASGDGPHRERRRTALTDAAPGARVAPAASVRGAAPALARSGASASGASSATDTRAAGETRAASASTDDSTPGSAASLGSASDPGSETASPGRGILEGSGRRSDDRARVAFGRPAVDRGRAATQAERQDPRVRDDTDAEGLAASMMRRSFVNASGRESRTQGAGRGGVREGGAPGSGGGRREGGRASAYGPGDGRFAALDTSDSRYRMWVLESRRRVHDALHYPRARALAMDQGTSIYMIYVNRDGTLHGRARLVRTSGHPDLDQAALAAIEAATPFSAVPPDLRPDLTRIPIRLPIEFSNPMVR